MVKMLRLMVLPRYELPQETLGCPTTDISQQVFAQLKEHYPNHTAFTQAAEDADIVAMGKRDAVSININAQVNLGQLMIERRAYSAFLFPVNP